MDKKDEVKNQVCNKCGRKIVGWGSLLTKIVNGKLVHIKCPEPKPDEGRWPTYKDFLEKYGKRPADIVFAIAQKDTAEIKDAEHDKVLRKMVLDYDVVIEDGRVLCEARIGAFIDAIEECIVTDPRIGVVNDFLQVKLSPTYWNELKDTHCKGGE